MSAASQGDAAAGGGASSRRTTTPPTRPPSQTPPITTAPGSRPGSSHKAQQQMSPGQLNPKAMGSAKGFEGTRSSRSRDSLISRAPRTPEVPPLPNPKEELLKTLQSQFDSLRSVITCKICYGLLYEPYTTTCGHTYCYICFCKSFQPSQIPACPECRGKLANPPAPAYAVREMTHAFVANQELLPTGESIEDHKAWQKEHADIIQKDKDNKNPRDGGIWRGFFRPRRPRMFPIHDYEDGVDRCPFCTWELEDGMCNRCGLPIDENGNGDWEFSDIASEHPSIRGGHDIVIEEDYDVEDDFINDEEEGDWPDYEAMEYAEDMGWGQPFAIQRMLGGHPPHPRLNRRPASHSAAGSRSRYSASVVESEMGTLEEEDEDEDEDSSMSGFVVDDAEGAGFSREGTSASESHSSRFPESIAEDDDEEEEGDDEEEEDDGPVAPGRRRARRTLSSTPTITSAARRPPQTRPQQPANRRRRVISETPSTESTSSASAAAEDGEGDAPIPPTSRRRRRPLSQEEPTRRVRPRARGNSIPEEEGSDPWGYRPLGTPQIGDEEDELSDGGRTEVGWEPITNPNERLRDTGSLTPTADRPSTPPRPASRNSSRFPLGSRGIRRRSSVVSVVHYEDNDADGESDSQQNGAQPALQTRPSRAGLRNTATQQAANTALAPSHIIDTEDTDSGDTETSPQAVLRGIANRRRRDYDPYVSMLLAQHRTEVQSSEPEGPVYAEFEHLRGIVRTPVIRPRTANRNRINAAAQSTTPNAVLANPGPAARTVQQVYSPSRFRGTAELIQSVNTVNGISRPIDRIPNSPRTSISGPSQMGASSRFRGVPDANVARHDAINRQSVPSQLGPSMDPRVQASNAALMRSIQSSMITGNAASVPPRQNVASGGPQPPRFAQANDLIERPVSRVSLRNGYAIQHAPSAINRPPSNTNRPPSAGSRRGSLTRSPFAPPQIGPAGVGLGTARAWHPSNPFFNGVRPRQSSQRLRNEASNQTLRPQRSVRGMRGQPPQVPSPEPDQTSPQMRPSASRMHLRPQPSYRRLHIQRDPNIAQYQQAAAAAPAAPRYSPSGSSTLSEDERVRRATELVQRRMQELAQQQRASPAATARLSAAAQQRIEQRLASNMGRTTGDRNPAQTPPASTGVPMTTATQQPAAINRMTVSRTAAPSQQTNNFPPAPTAAPGLNRPQPNAQAPQRTHVDQTPSRSQVPTMAQGVTAITTGGDTRRN